MKLVALTGGIGSGKSSVSERLTARGAVIIDADAVVKELQAPGQPVFEAMVERWGQSIVGDDGNLDRAAIASLVFGDQAELDALNGIVHPGVRREMKARARAISDIEVVVFDIPLLVEGDPDSWGASRFIVVDCPPEVAVERLMGQRGFDRADAEARMANQASRDDRLAIAHFVIDNSGDVDQLDAEVARCWEWLASEVPPSEPVTGDR
ncbi:MAG: dephospho-CoA kinase [Actinomycetia bacterium]|nr:dephospho-CoA kinase [Actinomycetes bacterium]MCP4228471.1 dephospho-CoA kinase [Actinomycetes bacterium]MCP5032835.1 dephospho-CoA kinase [Actinomycetes bacterium]